MIASLRSGAVRSWALPWSRPLRGLTFCFGGVPPSRICRPLKDAHGKPVDVSAWEWTSAQRRDSPDLARGARAVQVLRPARQNQVLIFVGGRWLNGQLISARAIERSTILGARRQPRGWATVVDIRDGLCTTLHVANWKFGAFGEGDRRVVPVRTSPSSGRGRWVATGELGCGKTLLQPSSLPDENPLLAQRS